MASAPVPASSIVAIAVVATSTGTGTNVLADELCNGIEMRTVSSIVAGLVTLVAA